VVSCLNRGEKCIVFWEPHLLVKNCWPHLHNNGPESHQPNRFVTVRYQFLGDRNRWQNGSLYATGLLSALSGCDVGVLWPNGCMDQDETRSAFGTEVGLRPGNIVLDGDTATPHPSPPHKNEAQQLPIFRPMYSGQTTGWIKIPLGRDVDLRPRDSVKWGPSPPPKWGHSTPHLWACTMAKRLD